MLPFQPRQIMGASEAGDDCRSSSVLSSATPCRPDVCAVLSVMADHVNIQGRGMDACHHLCPDPLCHAGAVYARCVNHGRSCGYCSSHGRLCDHLRRAAVAGHHQPSHKLRHAGAGVCALRQAWQAMKTFLQSRQTLSRIQAGDDCRSSSAP